MRITNMFLFCRKSSANLSINPRNSVPLRTKYNYGFLLICRRQVDHFKVKMVFVSKIICQSYSEKCHSKHDALCPSKHGKKTS